VIIARALLDTNIISALMRKDPKAFARAESYRGKYPRLTISLMTHFEVLRGLLAIEATQKLANYQLFHARNKVLPMTEVVMTRAADIYADLHRRGQLIPDADIIIAATALEYGLVLETNNRAAFSRIPGLTIENWLI